MNKRGGLECAAFTLAREQRPGQPMQFPINRGCELGECSVVSRSPILKAQRDLACLGAVVIGHDGRTAPFFRDFVAAFFPALRFWRCESTPTTSVFHFTICGVGQDLRDPKEIILPSSRCLAAQRILVLGVSAVCAATFCAAAVPSFSQLPLSFEPNRGQGDPSAQFFARGAGYTIAIRATGALVSVRDGNHGATSVSLHWRGASAPARPTAEGPLPGKVNYFLGSQPAKWHTDIPTFSAVRYANLYPGVDILYHGSQGRLEYDFELQPHANPGAIVLSASGGEKPRITAEGDLILAGLRQLKPVAYEETAGGRKQIACRYELTASGEVRFSLGAYDRSRVLIIDPVLSYATYIGGSSGDTVMGVQVDKAGNLYMAGSTTSANLSTKSAVRPGFSGSNSPIYQVQFGDGFVAKLNPAGTALIYCTYLGGSGDDLATAIAVDSAGDAYVVGGTQSSDFPATPGALQTKYKGFTPADMNGINNFGDGFLVKLAPNGDALAYGTYLGGTLNDVALGVAVDSKGDAVVVGGTESSDFPVTTGALASTYQGNSNEGTGSAAGDAFVTVVNPDGSGLVFSTYLGGNGIEEARGVVLDAQGNIYVTGMTDSANFPTTPGAYQTAIPPAGLHILHVFVTKITPQGSLSFSTYLAGDSLDRGAAIAVDAGGNVYVTGSTNSPKFPITTGAAQATFSGRSASSNTDVSFGDGFVTELNPTGSAILYSTYLGGSDDDSGTAIAVDSAGNAYVAGATMSTNFPVSGDALQKTLAGFGGQAFAANPNQGFDSERPFNTGDAFLAKLSSTAVLLYSSYYGGSKDDAAFAMAMDAAGDVYLGGVAVSSDLPTASAVQSQFGGAGTQFPRGDGFVAKFSFGGTLPGPAAKVTVDSSFNGTGNTGAALQTPFKVLVADAGGNPVPGVTVAFTATGATVNPGSAITDAQGHALTAVTLGATAGSGSVTATVSGLAPATANLTINATSGNGPTVTAVVNGASFQAPIAGGSWITIYVDQTLSAAEADVAPLPTVLGKTRVLVNGSAIPVHVLAPLSPSGTQINAQLPYGIAAGTAQLTVEVNGAASAAFPITVQKTAPGIFLFGANRAVAQNVAPDGSVSLNTDANPVPAGDYVVVYLTGQGPLNPPVASGAAAGSSTLSAATEPYSATLNGKSIPVAFLGMTPGFIALAQANIQIPKSTGPAAYDLSIKVGGVTSNAAKITVTKPRQ